MSRKVPWDLPVPNGWVRKRLKHVATFKAGEAITSDEIAPQGPYPVYGGNGLRGFTTAHTHNGLSVLIGRQGALCGNINYACGDFWASEHAIVATPLDDADMRWLGELLRALNLNQYSQSAAQPGISVDQIANIEVPVPPTPEQRAIGDYLEMETSRIDKLIALKRNLISLVRERGDATVAHAVLGGPPLPSHGAGHEQGSFPGHWKLVPFRWLFGEIDDRSATGEEILLGHSAIRAR
jgi:type I restriction enzyme S subunit